MKIIILAGGFGTRLREVVKDVPKPMAMIAGKPFLEHQLHFLKEQDLEDIVFCVHYMANTIKSYFGDGTRFGVKINYSEEETPLGTAGAVKNAEKYIDDTFLVLNGDSYSKMDLEKFLEFHRLKRGVATLGLVSLSDSSNYGKVVMKGNQIIDFLEKDKKYSGNEKALINSGMYLFEPAILGYIEGEKNVSLEREIFPKLAKEGKIYGYPHDSYFMDIGRPETYNQFKKDILENLIIRERSNIREAMQKIIHNGTDLILVVDENRKLLGVLNDKIIKNYLIRGGNLDEIVSQAMIKNPDKIGYVDDDEDKIHSLLLSGARHLPIIDRERVVKDIRFHVEEVKNEIFPVVRGRAPLRISFTGGGIDVAHFFEKYGGVAINATIDKHCHATAVKRADSNVIITSDMKNGEYIFNPKKIEYDGNFDIVKAVTKITKPNFGFDLYLHNDVAPGRGLGSSASLAVLVTKLINQLQGNELSDDKVAQIAYHAERQELGIEGGWQDQYAAVTGGFNYMEFSREGNIIYPLRLKENVANELASHLLLCYVGKGHSSGELHESQKKSFQEDEAVVLERLTRIKNIAIEIKNSLLTNNLEKVGSLFHESWENKKKIDKNISNPKIDELYDAGIKNGAYGGRLLGAGGGGYLLFYYPPQRRNKLISALENTGGEIMDFNFDFEGTRVWYSEK